MGIQLCKPAGNHHERRMKKEKVLSPDSIWIGVDLGGTSAKVGVVDGQGRVLASHSIAHAGEKSELAVVKRIGTCTTHALRKAGKTIFEIVAVGVGAPGGISNGCVIQAANFPGWKDVPLADMVRDELRSDLPIVLVNDADAATCAELWVGAAHDGKGASSSSSGRAGHPSESKKKETNKKNKAKKEPVKDLVLLTLGTGVGAGLILGGNLVSGATGTIEGGHHIVCQGGKPCPCGQRGCMEQYCSATGVVGLAKDAMERCKECGTATSLSKHDGPLTCKQVFEDALSGDETALGVVKEMCHFLAVGCINFMRIVDPAVIVLAGGVAEGKSGSLLLANLRAEIKKETWTCLPTPTRIALASAGRQAGIVGSVAAARMLCIKSISEGNSFAKL